MKQILFSICLLFVSTMSIAQDTPDKWDTDAVYPGGEDARTEFIKNTILYPADLVESEKKNKVVVGYSINEAGELVDLSVLKSSGFASFDEEVIRVYQAMPTWKPATLKGTAVKSDYYEWVDYVPEWDPNDPE